MQPYSGTLGQRWRQFQAILNRPQPEREKQEDPQYQFALNNHRGRRAVLLFPSIILLFKTVKPRSTHKNLAIEYQ